MDTQSPPLVTNPDVSTSNEAAPQQQIQFESDEQEPKAMINAVSLSLEQCGICSTHYEELPHQSALPNPPDINRLTLICKLLDVTHPQLLHNGHSFYSRGVPLCPECSNKLQKYEKLQWEINSIRKDIASSVIDTLVYIRPSDKTPLHSLRSQIMARWITRITRADHPTPHILDHSPRKDRRGSSSLQPKQETQNDRWVNVTTSKSMSADAEEVSTPTLLKVGPSSWIANDLSIVANSESEAQEILQAYVSGNVIQAEVSELELVEMEQDEGAFGCYVDPAAHVTVTTSNNEAFPTAVSGDESSDDIPKSSKKKKVVKERRGIFFQRAPQHEKPPFFCEKCGRVFSKLSTLRNHDKTCEAELSGEESITCLICSHNVSTWLDLKFHIDEVHPNLVLEKCRFCKKDFLPSTIEGHDCVRPATSETPVLKTYSCDFCHKVYYKYTSLTEHVRRSHPSMKKFICSLCHKQFVSKEAKENHERVHPIIPEGKRTHVCSVCGIICTTAWGLREHTKLHTGARPYVCEVCGKTFRLQTIKRNHMVVHTKEKNFECEFCGRTYSLYATMYRHWKKCRLPSAPRKGRWCPICQDGGTLFQKLTSLKLHMLKKHPGTEEQDEICLEKGDREFGFEATEEVRPTERSPQPSPKVKAVKDKEIPTRKTRRRKGCQSKLSDIVQGI